MARLCPRLLVLSLLALLCAACNRHGSSSGTELSPQVVWTYHLGTARDLTADYIGDDILVCSSANALDWVDTRTGSVLHSVTDPQMYGNGLIWFASPDGQVFYMLRGGYTASGSLAPPADALSCRNSAGELQWETRLPAGLELISTAIATDRIFLIMSDGSVMAVRRNGEMLWYRQLDAVRLTGFAAYVSQQLVYLDREGYLCVADLDGNLVWRSEELMGFYSSTLELPDGSLALYDFPLALRCFDTTGKLLWRADFPEYSPGRGRLDGAGNINQFTVDRMVDALPGNGCVVAHPDGRISAYDNAGKLLWRSQPTGQAQLICSDAAGNVFGSVRGGSLYAFDSQGQLVWEFDKLGMLNSAPSVDGRGHLFVESNFELFCLDPQLPPG